MCNIRKSRHIQDRQRQRGLIDDVLNFILEYGHTELGQDVDPKTKRPRKQWWFQVRECDVPPFAQGTWLAQRARSWLVVVNEDGTVAKTAIPVDEPARERRAKCVQWRTWIRKRRRRVTRHEHQ